MNTHKKALNKKKHLKRKKVKTVTKKKELKKLIHKKN
jgi:hypothetical protein